MDKMKMAGHLFLSSFLLISGLFLSGCGSSDSSKGPAIEGSKIAIVNTRNKEEANIAVINYDTGETWNDLLDVEGACNLSQYGDYIYIVDKTANKIIKFDYKERAVVKDLFTGDSTKPYSICFVSETKAYIALNNTTYIGIFNPETMEMAGQIDISTMAASDNKIQQYHCMLKGDRLFVTLRHNTRNSEKTSGLAVIDTATDEIVKELELQTDGVSGMGQTAIGGRVQTESSITGNVYVCVVNSMKVTDDGSIEIIDDIETANPVSRIIAEEADYGGSMATWVFDSNTTGWAIVGLESNYGLIRFDLSGDGTFENVSAFQGMEYSYALECTKDGFVIVGVRNEDKPGIWVYDSKNDYNPVFDSALNVGLMPNRILIVR